MNNINKQNNDNILEFKTKTEKPKKVKKEKNISGKQILLGIAGVLLLAVVGIAALCPIKQMEAKGMKYYSQEDIISAVKTDHYIPNSVFLLLRNKVFPIKTMPFVENIDVRLNGPNSVMIKVNENLRAGCILYSGKYIYFDKYGNALEVMNQRLKDVPLVTGLSYDNIVIHEKLPVRKKGYFSKIIKITTLITKNELTIDEIQFKKSGQILLKKGELNIYLGDGSDLDSKLSVLPGVLRSLKYKKGSVHMELYTKNNKIITFKRKK